MIGIWPWEIWHWDYSVRRKSVKIAFLQAPFPLNLEVHGGVERIELEELNYIAEKGYQTKLFVPRLIGSSPLIEEITDISREHRILKNYYFFDFLRKAKHYDIFHGHYTPILGLLAPRKSLIHFHGWAMFELPLYRYFARRYHEAFYVFNSKYTKQRFEKKYPAIAKDKLITIYNGININAFKPNLNKITSQKTKICFYGGWIPVKGIYDILDAIKILETKRKDFEVYFGGSAFSHYHNTNWGKHSYEIDKKVRESASRLTTVKLIGDIKHKDISSFVSEMDFGLMPPTRPEPFGMVNIEMMACGLPVIGTRMGAISEIIREGQEGLLVEAKRPDQLANAIEYLLDNPQKRLEMGRAARERVEQEFSWEKHMQGVFEVYEKILNK